MQAWVEEYGPVFRMRLLFAHVSYAVASQQLSLYTAWVYHHACTAGSLCLRPHFGHRDLADAQNVGQEQAGPGDTGPGESSTQHCKS